MIYLMLFIYILLYSYKIKFNTTKLLHFMFMFIPIGLLLVLVLGLQDNVGTDYYSYLSLANATKGMGWIEARFEILFVYLVLLVRWFNNPQLIFVFVALIQVSFIMLIAFEIKKMGYKLHYFFFLYFALSLTFFNQFNGIRQYIAVYIIVYAILKLINNKKITYIVLVFIASLFHSSAVFFIALVLLRGLLCKSYSSKKVILILLAFLLLNQIDLTGFYNLLLSFTKYSNYIGSSYYTRMSIVEIITKIPKLIIVLFSAYLIDKKELGIWERSLINMAYIGCGVLIASFSSTVIWRFYQYLDLFIIFPSLFIMHDQSKKKISTLIIAALFVMLVIKIIAIPRGEYLYNSILLSIG